jgi:hypothetical protein
MRSKKSISRAKNTDATLRPLRQPLKFCFYVEQSKQRRNITRHQQQRQRQQHQPRKNTNTALRLFPSRSSERITSLSALPSMPITVFSSPKPVTRSTKTQALRV